MGPGKPDVVCPARERTMLATQADRIGTGVRSVMRRVESDQEGFIKLIQTAMTAQVREATIALETQQGRVINGAEKAMCDAELGVTRLLESITQKTQIQLESERSEVERLVHSVTLTARSWLDTAGRELLQIRTQLTKDSGRMVPDAELGLTRRFETITQRTQIQLESERSEVERLVHTVTLKAQNRLDAAGRDLEQVKTQVVGPSRNSAAVTSIWRETQRRDRSGEQSQSRSSGENPQGCLFPCLDPPSSRTSRLFLCLLPRERTECIDRSPRLDPAPRCDGWIGAPVFVWPRPLSFINA